jgi:predicted ATPase/DNA-binding SARP family transcriptional activator
VLLLSADEVVSSDRLIEELWGERPPASAGKLIQGYVSNLRRLLGPEAIVTRPPGYAIEPQPESVDLERFRRLLAEARGRTPRDAASLLAEALALWRGPLLSDLTLHGAAASERRRLDDVRAAALADRIEAELALGGAASLVGELEALVSANPLDERLRGLLMLALYRSGRQADALRAYGDARRTLVEELGLDPSAALQRLERQMLVHDPELEPAAPPEPIAAAPRPPTREMRKVVTVLVTVATSSTCDGEPLDPESLRRVIGKQLELVRECVERHGGSIERLADDESVAVFGVPTAHEDDALRAARAAAELAARTSALSRDLGRGDGPRVEVRAGIETGEVLVGEGPDEPTFVTGDTVRRARRLARAAGPDEIVVGGATFALVGEAVESEPVGPVVEVGAAFRLLGGVEPVPGFARHFDAPLVGRDRESALLHERFAVAVAEARCELVTILGEAGIGKTRLANELIAEVGDGALVLVGRCIPYGEGATYLPLVEVVDQLGGLVAVEALLDDADDGRAAAAGIAAALGEAGATAPSDEIFFAVRTLLERVARDRPLVTVFEDVHWAEPTLLDLIEYVAGFAVGTPILLVCLARPEFLAMRPSAAGETFALQPLSRDDAETLLDSLADGLAPAVRARIAATAEGNPLFLEQLLAHVAGAGGLDGATIPTTLRALLAARLDTLPLEERSLLERAAVVGREFWRTAVAELTPVDERGSLAPALLRLARAGLVHADRSTIAGEDAFRFHHVLIRDAAYASVPKAERAHLHERLAAWLESRSPDADELIGYHLEQAFRCRSELEPADERTSELARRGGERLACAAAAASRRADAGALGNLVPRAVTLLAGGGVERPELLLDLATGLYWSGDIAQTETVLEEVTAAARRLGDERLEWLARLELAWLGVSLGREGSAETLRVAAEAALSASAANRDERGQARAWQALGHVHMFHVRCEAAAAAYERALAHCRRFGDRLKETEIIAGLQSALVAGPVPVEETIRRVEANRTAARMPTLSHLVPLEVMRGRLAEARTLYAEVYALAERLGHWTGIAFTKNGSGLLELRAGHLNAAEAEFRWGYAELVRSGVSSGALWLAASIAEVLFRQGRYEEAERFAAESEELAAADDLGAQWTWRSIRAKLLARRGETAEALALAREAVALSSGTDALTERARVLLDLAEVLRLAGDDAEMRAAAEEAIELYERKGDAGGAVEGRAFLVGSTVA